MPDELHERVKQAAAENSVSMNDWMKDAATQKLAGVYRSTDPVKRLDRLERDIRELRQELADLRASG